MKGMPKPGGKVLFPSASGTGIVNSAAYAVPHVVDKDVAARRMIDGRTWGNINESPHASCAYFEPGEGYRGVRLSMVSARAEDSGELVDRIREGVRGKSPVDPERVRHVAYFKVVGDRPLP